jgi:metallophosphoesterase superfamily enzyme
MNNSRILCIPDTHFPYTRKSFFTDFAKIVKTYNPDIVVHIGDVVDSQSISHHLPNPNAPAAVSELEAAKNDISKLVSIIGKRSTFICVGNHDRRYIKVASDVRIPAIYLKSFSELLGLPNSWKVANEHIIDGIYFTHGKSAIQGKTAHSYGMSTVEGHWHSQLSITYYSNGSRTIFSCFAGSALDDNSFAATYAANNLRKSIYGFLTITDGVPAILPL